MCFPERTWEYEGMLRQMHLFFRQIVNSTSPLGFSTTTALRGPPPHISFFDLPPLCFHSFCPWPGDRRNGKGLHPVVLHVLSWLAPAQHLPVPPQRNWKKHLFQVLHSRTPKAGYHAGPDQAAWALKPTGGCHLPGLLLP